MPYFNLFRQLCSIVEPHIGAFRIFSLSMTREDKLGRLATRDQLSNDNTATKNARFLATGLDIIESLCCLYTATSYCEIAQFGKIFCSRSSDWSTGCIAKLSLKQHCPFLCDRTGYSRSELCIPHESLKDCER